MDLSQYTQYVVPIIVAFCMCVGYVIKTSLDFIDNKYIPIIMLILGMLLNLLLNRNLSAETFMVGAISGLASIGTHQTCKCLLKKDKDSSNDDADDVDN